MTETFLDKTYGLTSIDATIRHYDAWSKSYDAETGANGYATPGRLAHALAGHIDDKTAPILDYGCGTGLSGEALRREGFGTVDGMDVSAEMLAKAKAKGVYRDLQLIDATRAPPVIPGSYPMILACGVIGSGAAPLSLLDALAECLVPGGGLAFSFNDVTLKDPAYPARVERLCADGFRMAMREHGAHLPGIGMQSEIYILEKL